MAASKCTFHGKLIGRFALQMLLSADIYSKLSILSPFLLSVGVLVKDQDFLVQIYYTCLFSLLKVKKLDADAVNTKLREAYEF